MLTKHVKHWQDPVNAVIGLWFAASPWLLGFSDHTAASVGSVIAGALLIAAALGAIFVPQAWEEWIEVALGTWMVISPWALDFAARQEPMLNAVVSGVLVALLALWVLATDKSLGGFGGDRLAH